jgi:cytochrome b6-f complex iron-sulfur subunit
MSPGTIALIVVAASIVLWAAFMVNTTIRRQRSALAEAEAREHPGAAAEPSAARPAAATASATAAAGTPEVTVVKPKVLKPLTTEQLAVSRRQFLNRAWTFSFTAFLGFFGMSTLSFLWPSLTGGFGTKISVGNYDDLLAEIGPANNFKPKFISEGRFFLVYYEGTGDAPVYLATGAGDLKIQALYRKCVHLGCSVPHCDTSQLFECPCHGSKYRLTGEYYGGPAPRGLDRFPIAREGDTVVVDTGRVQVGPPRGTNTWEKFSEPVGPFCIPV